MSIERSPRISALLAEGEIGRVYTVNGWARTRRGSKNVAFIALTDGSTPAAIQVVVPKECPDFEGDAAAITTGASLTVVGTLVESQGKGQRVELLATSVTLVGASDSETYPLQKKGHTMEFLRSIAHLRPRANAFGAVFRIRSTLAQQTHRFFGDQGFQYVNTPIITASDCEGAGEMFEVVTDQTEPFFGTRAHLTVSGQLNAEAMAYGLGQVYTFGPTFRAENSHTARHLSEFWMVEPEMAFYDLDDNQDLAEAYLKSLVNSVFTSNLADLELLNRFVDKTLLDTLDKTRNAAFERVTYTDAVNILQESGQKFQFPVSWGIDLQTEHERFLAEEYFNRPTIITNYPKDIKAFYMYQNDDNKTVGAMDVLVPRIGEIIGGSQREHRMDPLNTRLKETGKNAADYEWYLDLNRYGSVPHSGFGLGFERAVMFCTGMTNIRDVIPFPRSPGQAAF